MIRLSRETRFALAPTSSLRSRSPGNSWAGWPATNLLVPQLRLQLTVSGVPHPVTGYLCNIKIIDDLLRQIVLQRLIPIYDGTQSAEQLLRIVAREVKQGWSEALSAPDANVSPTPPGLQALTLHLTPYLSYTIYFGTEEPTSTGHTEDTGHPFSAWEAHSMIELTEQFEFSAAHRLHCDSLDEEENRRLFGKCNNLEGHGHNYVVEVSIASEVDSDRGQVINLDSFEATVKRLVVDRLDHKHLNRDVDHFASINPSVENIAIAIFDWLDGEFGSARLTKVKVFETPKTWAEYCGSSKAN